MPVGCWIEAEGEVGQFALFEQALKEHAPSLALVERVVSQPVSVAHVGRCMAGIL